MTYRYLIEECSSISIGTVKHDRRFEQIAGELSLTFDSGEGRRQRIALDEAPATYGLRHYFLCGCGVRVNKLFLPPGESVYKCRNCYRLRYELTTINLTSVHGELLYRSNRILKLAEKRADMGRIVYKGRYTKRFSRFLNLCKRAGLGGIVDDALHFDAAIASL